MPDNVGRPPFDSPMYTPNGNLNNPWARWFSDVFIALRDLQTALRDLQTASAVSGTFTRAKLTTSGSPGSETVVNGVITALTPGT